MLEFHRRFYLSIDVKGRAARVAMALGAASVMPTASVIAASLVTDAQRPAAMSVVFGGLTTSMVLALPISSAVAELAGWRAAWFVAAGAAFLAAMGVAFGVPGGVRGTRSLRPCCSPDCVSCCSHIGNVSVFYVKEISVYSNQDETLSNAKEPGVYEK